MFVIFFFKQKTAYEMRISDWSSDVCSSDLTSSYVDWREWSFANVDISLHLTRMPEGEWIRIAAETDGAGNGIAIVHARLADERGEIGHAHQTLFLDRRRKP